ncbi:MAG: penicillin-binding protein 2 [Acidimicrobiia bacterium]|nr:penicillin-binding protein 2 [Acidimicrobiia bacterium]
MTSLRSSANAPRPRRRIGMILVALLVGFGGISVRLVQVQALGGDRFTDFGTSQRMQTIVLPGVRGSIFDRNGNDLAVSLAQSTIWANPTLIAHPVEVAAALAGPLVLDPAATAALAGRLDGRNSGTQFAYVARQVDDSVADSVAKLKLPGIAFLEESKRFTPADSLAHSVLGGVGIDNLGQSGLERQYNELLSGTEGQLIIETDVQRRALPGGEHELKAAQRGEDLVLTIDRSMQYETERALRAQIEAKDAQGGMVVVSRPETGEILALANFQRDAESGELVATGNNMAVTTVYEPGSVNKVITVAAAIEEGLVVPETLINVPDSLQVSDHRFSDSHPHPTEDYSVTRILTESSNIGTIKLAQMLGGDRVDSYLRRFGFGTATDLDFPHEAAGILLDPDDYSGTSIGAIPIGQGIAVTAMQMLEAYNVLANDGLYMPPQLVMATVDSAGQRHEVPSGKPHRVVSATTARQLRAMLVNVVAEGTGKRGGITGYTVAGKTGTARKPLPQGGYRDGAGNYHYVANFVGFLPADNPELSIIVVIDEPSADIFGGTVAAPVFADLAQYGMRLLRIPPPRATTAGAVEGSAQEIVAVVEQERVRATTATSTTIAAGG